MGNPATKVRVRVLLIFFASVTAVSLLVWMRSERSGQEATTGRIPEATRPTPAVLAASPESPEPLGSVTTPSPSPADMKAEPAALPENSQPAPDASFSDLPTNFVGTLRLIIPVAGVKPDQVVDTFTASRSEGRVHDAIDIMAPAGTPVFAAADGEIVKLFQSERGGTTIYQLSPDKKLVFYYAHLQRYADGLAVGKFARQGEEIGYVGDTGNAGAGNYHLHFSVSIVADPKRYWEGKNINPYPLLRR